jgi:hypothetical protein
VVAGSQAAGAQGQARQGVRGVRSGRKTRYGHLLAAALDPDLSDVHRVQIEGEELLEEVGQ